MARSRYALEIAAGFTTRDRRVMTWYRAGRKFSGAVCICTCGDTLDIIKENIDFFWRHFNPAQAMPWQSWKTAYPCKSDELTSLESSTLGKSEKGILVTASRKPLINYGLNLSDFEILDIPLRTDFWHDGGQRPKVGDEWCSSVFVTPEVLLFHVNYILRNAAFKSLLNKKRNRVCIRKAKGQVSAD